MPYTIFWATIYTQNSHLICLRLIKSSNNDCETRRFRSNNMWWNAWSNIIFLLGAPAHLYFDPKNPLAAQTDYQTKYIQNIIHLLEMSFSLSDAFANAPNWTKQRKPKKKYEIKIKRNNKIILSCHKTSEPIMHDFSSSSLQRFSRSWSTLHFSIAFTDQSKKI